MWNNYTEAVEWFKKSVDSGNIDACVLLGNCYRKGNGVKKDLNIAASLFEKGANDDDDD